MERLAEDIITRGHHALSVAGGADLAALDAAAEKLRTLLRGTA